MRIESDTRRPFGVEGFNLTITAPYVEGITVNEHEANVLNQVVAENCRNNLRETVKKMKEDGKTQEDVQKLVDEWAADYDFGQARTVGPRLDPVESAVMELALELAKRAAKKQGEKLAELGLQELKKRAKDIAEDPNWGPRLRQKAETIAAARQLDV